MKDELFISGVDYPAAKGSYEGAVCTDSVTLAAQKAFGITYLFPWQRIVIANILDAAVFYNPDAVKKSQEIMSVKNDKNEVETKEIYEGDEYFELDSDFFEAESKFCATDSSENKNEKNIGKEENAKDPGSETDCATYGKQIVLLPTGAGKSLCFLTPALLLNGPTLVLYPLLALMADQKRRMDEGGLTSVIFRGGQTAEEREENFRKLREGAKIILANPEVLQKENLLTRLADCGIAHIAIDEAHVTSEWGDTFRPAYLTLGEIIKKLKVPVVTAFTATASPQVLSRISEVLFDGNAHIVRSDSDRPNIHYEVINTFAKKRMAFQLALTRPKPLIIFCGTRSKSEDMARELAAFLGEDKVKFYHAGMEKEEKTAVEKWFYPKTDGILCCTCAFGMGVDKKDIHTVIHLEVSPTAESYIQEAGRGGRDGSIATAVLLWSKNDSMQAKKFDFNSRERVLSRFAESQTCRRQILLDALGGEQAACDGCDVCLRGSPAPYAEDAETAFKFIKAHRKIYNAETLNEKLLSVMNRKYFDFTKMNVWDTGDCAELISQLEAEEKIRKCSWPWKNKIDIKGKKIPDAIQNPLHPLA